MIFRDAGEYNMTGEGHVWIVTEQALHANNTPDGVLGLQLEHAHSDKGHIRVSELVCGVCPMPVWDNTLIMHDAAFQDSVYVLASAIKEMISNETIAEAPKDCGDSAVNWESGE